ncbi:TolC family outer membrane protein [Methylomarinum vadi]|uniref:TolC family outer membrane protein n=1 Tax=Methylomarinum vadi TaxID=438855 RepID=UPI001F358915|nr:TolC family outer membrane protein [Methylomarinum vadi]
MRVFKLKLTAALLIVCAVQPGVAQDLIETYRLALENDPEIKSAYYNQFSTGEIKSQSIAQMLPNISLQAASSRNRLFNKKVTFQGAGKQEYWNQILTINFRQPVFNWGHWIQLSQSDNRIAQAEAEYQAQYLALIVKTTEAYFDILAAQDNLEFTIAEQKAIEKQLEQAKQRFEVGLIAITDVYEAQAAYDQARANEIDAVNQLDDAKESLRELIGENEADLNPLHKKIILNKPEPADIASWTESAANSNFTIVAQLNQAEVARKEIQLQQSGHLPTLDIVANYNVQDNNSRFGLRGDYQAVGLELNLPLFEGGGTYSRAEQAHYDYQRAKEDLIKVKRSVTRQVRNAYRGVLASLSRVHALAATVKSSESALEATEAGFEVGTRTMVDVLAEQRNLYRSKRDYARSRYDYLINGIKLKEAAGSLSEEDIQQVNQFLTQ